jgi:hypothetical protein
MINAQPDFVVSVMRDPRVWEWVCEDGVRPEQFDYRHGDVYFRHADFGFITFRRTTMNMQEVHIAMKKGATGVHVFTERALDEMRRRGARKFLAPIGDWNKAALRLARQCGFVEEGRVSGAWTRNGVPHAMVLMGSE